MSEYLCGELIRVGTMMEDDKVFAGALIQLDREQVKQVKALPMYYMVSIVRTEQLENLQEENAALKSAMYRVRAAIDDPLGSQAERLEKAGDVCDKALGSE